MAAVTGHVKIQPLGYAAAAPWGSPCSLMAKPAKVSNYIEGVGVCVGIEMCVAEDGGRRVMELLVQESVAQLLSDYAESLRFITFVVFLFRIIEICMSALPEKMDHISLCVVVLSFGLKDLSPMEIHENMVVMEGSLLYEGPRGRLAGL